MFRILLVAFSSFVIASGARLPRPPTPHKQTSAAMSGQYDCEAAGEYLLCQNLWGEYAGVGSQNSTFIGSVGNAVSWTTSWNWTNGPNNVKSCMVLFLKKFSICPNTTALDANVESNNTKGVQVSGRGEAEARNMQQVKLFEILVVSY